MKVLYFCEGFTDIRFVTGLSEICDLTMAVPSRQFQESGLAERVAASGARVQVDVISGGRLAFQAASLRYLVNNIRRFDVVLSQEMGRGSLNATLVGRLMGVPVVTYLGTSPIEYFRCRRERGQVGPLYAVAGEVFLRSAMRMCGALGTAVVTTGPYLRALAARISARAVEGHYCGIDCDLFSPVTPEEKGRLRLRHQLPADAFLILFSSRISHEKDPETLLRAVARAREQGLNAVVMNLGGGFQEFLALAGTMGLRDAAEWTIGRPAVHPMKELCEYVQAADLVVQASLAEGGGMSPLEALSCGTPVVATRVGGMSLTLEGIAQLTPRRDAEAMATAMLWVSEHPSEARAQAMRGRECVQANWHRPKVFSELKSLLEQSCGRPA